MAAIDHTRAPRTTLDGGINNSTTSIDIASATGWPTPGDSYYAKIFDSAGTFLDFLDGETVLVTGLSGTTLTVTRGSDDTSAASWSDGDHIVIVGSATALDSHDDHANTTSGTPHGAAYLTPSVHDSRSHASINAGTATAWATGRTVSLTGDVTGTSGSLDGSGNVSLASTIAVSVSTFTPTMTQSASLSLTDVDCWYIQIGEFAAAWGEVQFDSAGTASNALQMILPISVGTSKEAAQGSFVFNDSGANTYTGHISGAATTDSITFRGDATGSGGILGTDIAITVASGDRLRFMVIFYTDA